jgi:dipeptidyl aminopeptidase/acylaminoacyl peptidase/formylglycine-generating enzyme required for sulfatase activity
MNFRQLRFFVLVALCSGFANMPHAAEESKTPAKTSPWKPEDVVFAETTRQFRISPDGQWVAWIKAQGDKEKDAVVSNLYLSSLSSDAEIQLTRGTDTVSSFNWSPDGKWIAFVSSKARPQAKPDTAATQIWLINPHGGEPYVLTELARGPQRVDWMDKETVIFSAEEDPSAYEQAEKKRKDDSEVADDADHKPPVRLFKINVKDKKITRLTANSDWIGNWSVSKDGKYAVAVHEKSLHYTFDQKVPPITILHNLAEGTEKQIFIEGRIYPRAFSWAPDNGGFYVMAPYSTDPKFITASIERLYFYDVASGKGAAVPLDWENGVGSGVAGANDGFIAGLAAGSRFDVSRYTRSKSGDVWTWKRTSLEGDTAKNIENFEVTPDGKTLVYIYSTSSVMPQLYRAQLDGNKLISAAQLTHLNDSLIKSRAIVKAEVIRWKGANNDEVEGILHYPAKYEAGKKYPLITAIHGGPAGSDKDFWDNNWAYPLQLLTQRGAFVLQVNYHGSNNYGLKWVESICCGKYYDLETPDINAGVDFLIEKGLVDADKVATLGWSNGSILSTSLLVTYPDRYKVASVGAGDVEWISDWGNVVFGDSFDSYYFGKSPMEDPNLYIRKSPFFKMDKVKAPVLIFHGTADTNVPTAQSWSYFRALQYYGKVPVKFVIFPGEPHGPRKLTHQMRKVEEEMAWFDKYFFKTEKPANDAVKKGSPLEDLMHINARGGHMSFGTALVVPDVVRRGDLEIGRFEVTALQYADFLQSPKKDAHGKLKPGTVIDCLVALNSPNKPQSGVSLADAQAYAAWLSKETGQTWRLPYEDEVKGLYENRDGENTLDFWAGYAPNPEDAAKLREAAKRLNGPAPLLKEVGNFHGQGKDDEEPIYDLGGNVAEWVLTRDGKGKVIGGSADCPADPKATCTPEPEYVGFRVVRGAAKP